MRDYSIFYMNELDVEPTEEAWKGLEWDLFISAYNKSDRVITVFNKSVAEDKFWLIQPDYNISAQDFPKGGEVFEHSSHDEVEFIDGFLHKLPTELGELRICIDITGFIKPYMMRLFLCLMSRGVKKLDVLYSEPGKYAEKEKTKFSGDYVKAVHVVPGFGNIYNVKTDNDVLIIGAGYDDHLITSVATEKSHARKVQIFGLPSLRADMYQENILRAHKAGEAVDGRVGVDVDNYFSPANNPFITAETLSQVYNEINSEKEITNLYLSPLATKPQALGFTIFYLTECLDKPVSMLYPYCDEHVQKTSTGISRIWKYVVEFID